MPVYSTRTLPITVSHFLSNTQQRNAHQLDYKPSSSLVSFISSSTSKPTSSSSSLLVETIKKYKLSRYSKMGKKRSDVAQRAWNVVRLALLWARKGGMFRRCLMELRLVPKYLKNLGHSSKKRGHIFYQEREPSFDKTSIFQLKTHRSASMRFLMSCASPQVDFESYDFNADDGGSYEYKYDDNENEKCGGATDDDDEEEEEEEEEEWIDTRAEKFVAQFYQQMRMQR